MGDPLADDSRVIFGSAIDNRASAKRVNKRSTVDGFEKGKKKVIWRMRLNEATVISCVKFYGEETRETERR